jgi:hypothetical protein
MKGATMEADEPIQIYSVNNPMIAELIRNALLEEGIACELSGEAQGGFAGVLNEIQILTKAADADRALAIIKEMEHHRSEAEEGEEIEGPEDAAGEAEIL